MDLRMILDGPILSDQKSYTITKNRMDEILAHIGFVRERHNVTNQSDAFYLGQRQQDSDRRGEDLDRRPHFGRLPPIPRTTSPPMGSLHQSHSVSQQRLPVHSSNEQISQTNQPPSHNVSQSTTQTANRFWAVVMGDSRTSESSALVIDINGIENDNNSISYPGFIPDIAMAPSSPPRAPVTSGRCSACMDETEPVDLLQLFACTCKYCRDCLYRLFMAGCTDIASFPPKCCGKVIPLVSVAEYMTSYDINRYKEIEKEFATKTRLYCAEPRCSTFIPESAYLRQGEIDIGICPSCSLWTCTRCKNDMRDHSTQHEQSMPTNVSCPTPDTNTQALYQLSSKWKWRQCPFCNTMVERLMGCCHIECVCGMEFCYRCGDLFNESNECSCGDHTNYENDDDDGDFDDEEADYEDDNDGGGDDEAEHEDEDNSHDNDDDDDYEEMYEGEFDDDSVFADLPPVILSA